MSVVNVLLIFFICFLQNSYVNSSPQYSLPVQPNTPLVISYVSPPQVKNVGEDAVIACTISNVMDRNVIWTSGTGTTIATKDIIQISDPRIDASRNPSSSTYYLRIRNLRESDSGIYKCGVAGRDARSSIFKSSKLDVVKSGVPYRAAATVAAYSGGLPASVGQPRIEDISPPQTKSIGDEVSFICTVSNPNGPQSPLSVLWEAEDGQAIATDSTVYSHDPRFEANAHVVFLGSSIYQLKIKNIQDKDSGAYRCSIYVGGQKLDSKDTRLEVGWNANPQTVQPRIKYISQSQVKNEGDEVLLTCTTENTSGQPLAWTRGDMPIASDLNIIHRDSRYHVIKDDINHAYHLKIQNLKESDSGTYNCEIILSAVAPSKKVSESVGLQVNRGGNRPTQRPTTLGTPNIISVSGPQDGIEGQSITLSCVTENVQDAGVMWSKDRKTTISIGADVRIREPRISIVRTGTTFNLVINNLQPSDSGTYSCVVYAGPVSVTKEVPVRVRSVGPYLPTKITSISAERTQNIGESTTLSCTVQNKQSADITWVKDQRTTIAVNDRLLVPDSRYTITADPSGSTINFVISNVQPQDAGTYTCSVSHRGPTGIIRDDFRDVRLTVSNSRPVVIPEGGGNPPPAGVPGQARIVSVSSNSVHNLGESVGLSCTVHDAKGSQVVWLKDRKQTVSLNDQLYLQDRRFRINVDPAGTTFTLTISNLQDTDAGTYSCMLYTRSAGQDSRDVNIQVRAHSGHGGGNGNIDNRPRITYTSPQQIKAVGESVDLTCTTENAEQYVIMWRKISNQDPEGDVIISTGNLLLSSDTRYGVQSPNPSTIVLNIRGIRPEDSGTYRCDVISPEEKVSGDAELLVSSGNPTPQPQALFFYPNSSDIEIVNANEDAKLECYAGGNPPPRVTWTRPGNQVLPNGGTSVVGNVLIISYAEDIHAGTYMCTADNGLASPISKNIELEVQTEPLVLAYDTEVVQPVGGNAELRCDVEAHPHPAIVWLKNNLPINIDNSKYIVGEGGAELNKISTVLQIRSITRGDYGSYTCRASNFLGQDEGTIQLTENRLAFKELPENPPANVVESPPQVAKKPAETAPTVELEFYHYSMPLLANLDIQCNVSGYPLPEVSWYKGSSLVKTDDPHYRIESTFISEDEIIETLRIFNFEKAYYGTYTCKASNSKGINEQSTVIEPRSNEGLVIPGSQQAPEVRVSPPEQEAAVNSAVELRCDVRANPEAQVVWYKDIVPIADSQYFTTGRSGVSRETTTATLRIYPLQEEHYGVYMCRATNAIGVEEQFANIKPVPGRIIIPEVRVSSPEQRVAVNSNVELRCDVTASLDTEVTWYKDNVPIVDNQYFTTEKSKVSREATATILRIYPLQNEHYGVYVCKATNLMARNEQSVNVIPAASRPDPTPAPHQQAPQVRVSTAGLTVPLNSNVTLRCDVRANPEARVAWYKNYVPVLDNQYYTTRKSGVSREAATVTLQIYPVQNEHYGVYLCRATNAIGGDERSVNVIPAASQPGPTPVPHQLAPQVRVSTPEQRVALNSNVQLRCDVRASPEAEVAWYKDNVRVQDNQYYTTGKSGVPREAATVTLQIDPVQNEHYGVYVCRATNALGIDEQSVNVVPAASTPDPTPAPYQQAPQVRVSTPEQGVGLNSNVKLRCDVRANPEAQVAWYKDNVPVQGNQYYTTGKSGASREAPTVTLQIYPVQNEHYGVYVCRATNALGVDEQSVNVVPVASNPGPAPTPYQQLPEVRVSTTEQKVVVNSKVELRCDVRAYPVAEVGWYKDNLPIVSNQYFTTGKSEVSKETITTALSIYPVQNEHYGVYVCRATNAVGVSEQYVNVIPDHNTGHTPAPPPGNKEECIIDDEYLNRISNKIADSITLKVLHNLENLDNEHDQLERIVYELQNEYKNIDKELNAYYNTPVA